MKGVVEPVAAAAAAEEADKEKKKRRRSNRRSKQNLVGCSSVDAGVLDQATENVKKPPGKALNVAFNSLPNMYISAEQEWVQDPTESLPQPDAGSGNISKSCPLPGPSSSREANGSPLLLGKNGENVNTARKIFDPHWSEHTVDEAIEKGNAFRAVFHVNAHNRQEAYCTLDGVPIDVLISGAAAQNRAIEGDIVAVALDPVASWTRLKGSSGHFSNSIQADDSNAIPEVMEVGGDIRNDVVDADCEHPIYGDGLLPLYRGYHCHQKNVAGEAFQCDLVNGPKSSCHGLNGHQSPDTSNVAEQGEAARALGKICAMISSYPSKRPTGRILAIIERSRRRDAIIGFLSVCGPKRNKNYIPFPANECIQLIPTDPKFPEMVIPFSSLPDFVEERLTKNDLTIEKELVAAQIFDWSEESFLPQAHVVHVLGRGGEIEPQIAAILFQHAISNANLSPEALSCLPDVPWEIPTKEIESRKDLRNICIFTIDPSSAIDLDDALSVEKVSDDIYRVGVHIADVSYFVLPETALDTEAQIRSTSVYMLQYKLPMLPPLLSEDLGSLNPGVDRLAFSIIWDINLSGEIVDHWLGHSVIHSCCKLSYEDAQDIIDGSLDAACISARGTARPPLHGQIEWEEVVNSIRSLHEISKRLKEKRFKDGALGLGNAKLVFLFDECGNPYDSILYEQKDSNFLVEEFMLLANKTAAEVISRTFPECALLRRHPEPNLRKLKEFKAFCSKHGFELDISSSGQLHLSLSKIRECLKNDPMLLEIFVSYASKPMQLATYFCTGDLRNRENDWAHYSLAVPLYTHFTSPLRRYPDIVVHRTLSAALKAEEIYLKQRKVLHGENADELCKNDILRCFTGPCFDKCATESKEGREALSAAAFKYKVPGAEVLSEIASYCNERKLASRQAEEAGERVYMWALLRRRETLISKGRVMGLGPRFMSVYIHKLAIERRIYYSEVEGLVVEWLETTSTLVLDLFRNKRFQRKGCPTKFNPLEEVALVMNPSELVNSTQIASSAAGADPQETTVKNESDPAVFPLTLQLFSAIPVVLHAVGGDDGPLDIGVRLYMSSYCR